MSSSVTDWQAEQIKEFRGMLLACQTIPELVKVARNLIYFSSQAWYLRGCLPAYNKRLADLSAGRKARIVLIVDFKAVCHLAYHRAKETNPAVEFANILINIKNAFKNDPLIVFADEMESGGWRYQADPRWKSQRIEPTKGFIGFVNSARLALDKKQVKRYVLEGYEADDLIASLAASYNIAGDKCVMVCDDRDLYQCLGPKTNMFWKGRFFTRESLTQTYAIDSRMWVDYLCMVGRNGIPGAVNIGDKTASKLLVTYGSYTNCLYAIDQIKEQFSERIAQGLLDFEKAYFDCYRLHKLNQTLDVEVIA